MGLAPESINVGTFRFGKSNDKAKKDEKDDAMETGCWIKLKFLGSCVSLKSKVDSSVSGSSTQLGISYCYSKNNIIDSSPFDFLFHFYLFHNGCWLWTL